MGFSVALPARALAILALALTAALLTFPSPAGAHPFHPGAENPVTTSSKFGGLRLARVGSYDYPVYVTSPRGDDARQFVVEQDGQIRLIKNGNPVGRPFLDISNIVEFDGGERGLLSMAFAPDYASSRRFYVMFTEASGDLRVEEFRRSSNPDVAVRSTRRRIIEIDHETYGNHNGGQLQFGPFGGPLYISTGDGGGGGDPLETGQNVNSLLGKILRVDPRHSSGGRQYSIPPGNPFVARSGADEIWHYGLRNPWRFSFDRSTGAMAIGDVGQNAYEEIDFVRRGRGGVNFGWDCLEGFHAYESCNPPNDELPVLEYSHEGGASCSVTGGYVVRAASLPSTLRGRYVYGDYCTGALHAAVLREGQRTPEADNTVLDLIVPRLTGFGEDNRGRLYMTSRSYEGRPGAVYVLRDSTP